MAACLTRCCWKSSRRAVSAPSCGETDPPFFLAIMSNHSATLDQPRARTLTHVADWIFDLDNTLYPARCNLFAQVDRRIGQFIEGRLGLDPLEAHQLQKRYFHEHGTT